MPSHTAQKNHDELFPERNSTLSITDPELIEVFDNFAFDEIQSHGNLSKETRLLTQLASTIAAQAHAEFRALAAGALNTGITPVQIKEVVYQAVPYVGMSKVLDFLIAVNELFTDRGIGLPLEGQATTSPADRMESGRAIQGDIFGHDSITAMYENAPDDEQHIQRALSGNCFGDFVTRSGLDVRTRELLTFTMLVSLGGCEPQLAGHIQGNLNIGNTREVLLDVLTQLIPFIGYPRTLNGLRVLDQATLNK
ncbi:carboxymuconolactone decarboxylase family protein [Changpingibacter yushuensis]|uniref:carboxymuconolactone decarboxylase family protein n=1 Tax=Changpingibacter yushuensis TaxID=2758440 RepID=UPI00165D9226|nr:carboxymuconolactone decarboxylase family protein [Changpingibacter yushuensis]